MKTLFLKTVISLLVSTSAFASPGTYRCACQAPEFDGGYWIEMVHNASNVQDAQIIASRTAEAKGLDSTSQHCQFSAYWTCSTRRSTRRN